MSRRLAQGRRHQKAVLWAFDSYGDDNEIRVSSTAVEIDVRWERKRTERRNPNSEPIATDFDVVVDQDVAINSIIWFGELDDWAIGSATGYRVVVESDYVPDIQGRNPRRVLRLAKHGNALPERV